MRPKGICRKQKVLFEGKHAKVPAIQPILSVICMMQNFTKKELAYQLLMLIVMVALNKHFKNALFQLL